MIELQRRIRAEEEVLTDLATFGNTALRQEAAQAALDRFLEGLMHYIARVVAYRIDKLGERAAQEKLIIYLLGNGWRFVLFAPRDPLAGPNRTPQEIIKEEVKVRLNRELELVFKAGMLPVKPDIVLQHPEDPKTVVARGALLIQDPQGGNPEKREPETFLGCDIRVVSPVKELDYHWNTSVPLNLKTTVNNVYISNALAGFEQLRVPDYQHPSAPPTEIQEVNLSQYVYEGGRIYKSVFSLYLERWYKRFLTGSWI